MLHKIRMDKLVCEALDSVLVLVGDDRDACTMWFIYGHETFVFTWRSKEGQEDEWTQTTKVSLDDRCQFSLA